MDLKLVSWNVNGIRAATKNGLADFIKKSDADILAFQEIKADKSQIPKEITDLGYMIYANPAERKGYSGTMVMTKSEPLEVIDGIGKSEFDSEGRVQTVEYDHFYFLNTYFPNSQRGLERLDFKIDFDREFMKYTQKLRSRKPVVVCGDFNVAHEEVDIARPKDNENNAGFTMQEREWMSEYISAGYIDTFRKFTTEGGHYSWWSYMFNARAKNVGWRIDYFVASSEIENRIASSRILEEVRGSDHAPLEMNLNF